MANSKLVCVIAILVTLMFYYGISSVVGRQLKAEYEQDSVTNSIKQMGALVGRRNLEIETSNPVAAANGISDDGVEQRTDDFRPTDPGHSPGAGHSYTPRSNLMP